MNKITKINSILFFLLASRWLA